MEDLGTNTEPASNWQNVASAATVASKIRENVESAYTALVTRQNKATRSVGQAQTAGTESLRSSQSELRQVNEQITELRREFDPTNLYSVVPLLVVRLGAVILLIFLTQILLAAYRYNTMLYTHYAAISDSLRMVPGSGTGPDYDRLEKITSTFYPKEASYAPPESPVQFIAKLADRKSE